jgi:hypothetical protein
MTRHTFTISSDLQVSVKDFLPTLTLRGVNAELFPLVKMTAPETWSSRSILEWPVQQPLFKSWILLLGILPIDRHSFYFDSIAPTEGFKERSSSTSNTVWCHARRITAIASGCRVTDTVEYQNRLPLLGSLFKPMYRLVFWCRHRNLRSRYCGRTSPR